MIVEKIKKINIDGILDSGYIREFLISDKRTIFPQMLSTERPDLACQSLLDGKIVIMVENSPIVLICPGVFIDFFHSPEDYYQKNWNVNFARIVRFLSFFITLLLPAFYVAITTFNPECLSILPTFLSGLIINNLLILFNLLNKYLYNLLNIKSISSANISIIFKKRTGATTCPSSILCSEILSELREIP